MNEEQRLRLRDGAGFIAALDQSGGSTPRALAAYGIGEDRYHSQAEMFDLVHEMRTRVITSPAFTSEHILAAILFTQTMRRQVDGVGLVLGVPAQHLGVALGAQRLLRPEVVRDEAG